MNKKRWLVLIIVPLLLVSCRNDDGPYVSISAFENLIYLSIKEYREINEQTGPFVHQPFVVNEAQKYSYKMANGVEEVETQGLDEHWNTLNDKFGLYNEHALVLKTDAGHEDVILTQLLALPDADSILLEDVTQCGVGVQTDTAGFNYVTVLLAKAD